MKLIIALCLISVFWFSTGENYTSCTRHDGKPGFWLPTQNCPVLRNMKHKYNMNNTSLTKEERSYQRFSRSFNFSSPRGYYCCEEVDVGMEILTKQECGMFHNRGYIKGGSEIFIMSRPWMALLKFQIFETEEMFLCGGTLITNRFVLTAAHCLRNEKLVSVRLGEHQRSTQEDCRSVGGHTKCAPPVQDIGIDRIFVHEEYSEATKHNDIALIKLSREVIFTDNNLHIRPICLPLNPTLQNKADTLEKFAITGWGTTENVTVSDVPIETTVSRWNRSDCQEFYQLYKILPTQVCAGHQGNDSCSGDSGGPLMYFSTHSGLSRFVQFGIVSYGSASCKDVIPGVYTNVGSFISWIANKIVK